MSDARTELARILALGGGLGFLPVGPGTWASIAAIPLAWGLHAAGGFPLLALATVAVFATGFWCVPLYRSATGATDPPEVVIDEIAGMWVALWPLSLGLWLQGLPGHVFPWPGWVLGFLAFRFFDILKPPPVSWADRMPGAMGVMLDDVVAGFLAALVAAAAAVFFHGWML